LSLNLKMFPIIFILKSILLVLQPEYFKEGNFSVM
jgi:hypothetical protein